MSVEITVILSVLGAVTGGIGTMTGVLGYVNSLKTRRESRRPILVFERTEERWEVENVGYGPALNLVVAQWSSEAETWEKPQRLPAIPSGRSSRYRVKGAKKLGAEYVDFLGRRYHSVCEDYDTVTDKGKMFPPWSQAGIADYRDPEGIVV